MKELTVIFMLYFTNLKYHILCCYYVKMVNLSHNYTREEFPLLQISNLLIKVSSNNETTYQRRMIYFEEGLLTKLLLTYLILILVLGIGLLQLLTSIVQLLL